MSKSTAHALPHIAEGSTIILRVIWLAFFIAASSVFLFHSYNLVENFLAQTKSVNINLASVSFETPDMHMCGSQPLSSSRMTSEALSRQAQAKVSQLIDNLEQFNSKVNSVDQASGEGIWQRYFWGTMNNSLLNDYLE